MSATLATASTGAAFKLGVQSVIITRCFGHPWRPPLPFLWMVMMMKKILIYINKGTLSFLGRVSRPWYIIARWYTVPYTQVPEGEGGGQL